MKDSAPECTRHNKNLTSKSAILSACEVFADHRTFWPAYDRIITLNNSRPCCQSLTLFAKSYGNDAPQEPDFNSIGASGRASLSSAWGERRAFLIRIYCGRSEVPVLHDSLCLLTFRVSRLNPATGILPVRTSGDHTCPENYGPRHASRRVGTRGAGRNHIFPIQPALRAHRHGFLAPVSGPTAIPPQPSQRRSS